VEPLAVVGYNLAGGLPTVDAARAVISRLGAIAVFVTVVDLALVALPELARDVAEEDARVEVLAVREHFELQGEISPLAVGLELTGTTAHVQPALGRDRECALVLLARMHLPAGQVFAVENARQAQWFELDVAELDLPLVELQADMPTAQGMG